MDGRDGSVGSNSTPAMDQWQTDYTHALPELRNFQRKANPVDVAISRASQMDAGRLDVELTNMLLEQFLKAFALIQPDCSVVQKYLNVFRPELSFLLDGLIFKFSVWEGRPTPGSSLMNLRYRNESSGNFYIWARLESLAIALRWGDQQEGSIGNRSWKAMQWVENIYRVASFANFVIFLRYGKYRSLLERLLQSQLVYKRASMPKALNFEYLNRQLVWHELSELLLFLLPLVNVTRIKAFVSKTLPQVYCLKPSSGSSGDDQPAKDVSLCYICMRREMPLPYIAHPCGHTFCYYCLRSHTEKDVGFECPKCSTVIQSMQLWTQQADPSH